MNHSVAPREEGEGEFERIGNMWKPVHDSMDMMITCIRTLQREREKDQTLYIGLREQYRQKNELVQVLNNENLELRQEVLKLNERIHRCQGVVTTLREWDLSSRNVPMAKIVWESSLDQISQYLNGSELS
jgi:hypothetical protein